MPMPSTCERLASMENCSLMFSKRLHGNERAWPSLILEYIEGERWQNALNLYQEMQENRLCPSNYILVSLLKACARLRDVKRGRQIHAQISQIGCECDLHVCRTLVGMYVKCGSLSEARETFDKLPVKNVVSWNALIAGYAEHGPRREALKCFEQMQSEGVSPNAVTVASVIKVCGAIGAFDKGREIHMMLAQSHSELGLAVGNTLIGMYAKCGSLSEAQEIFDKMPVQDVVSWTALIAGYAEHGPGQEALKCFREMQREAISPNAVTFACVLKACGSIGDLDKGQKIHKDIAQEEYETNLAVGNSLIGMYAKCGSLTEAQETFDELSVRDVVSWTALIAGYAEHGPGQKALKSFEQMQLEGIPPDAVTYACSLKACSSIGAIDKGQILHAEIGRDGFERDLSISNTLIGMYAKCNLLSEAEEVFNTLPARTVVSWTALIAGYSEHGPSQAVLSCFERMQLEGISPNDVTYCCVLKGCGSTGAMDKGSEIHMEIAHKGLERDLSLGKSLVGMYAKCGLLSKARQVFDKLLVQDVMSWTALIAGYAEHGSGHEALNCFEKMQCEHVCSNTITYVCAFKACGSIIALDKSRELHMEIVKKGFERDLSVSNSLISTYAKCGSFSEAWVVFDKLPVQDAVAWSSMIKGYAVNHEGNMAVQCFERMQKQGVKPDAVTFICLLTACSHASMLFEGQEYLKAMEDGYGIAPTVEHFTCMVDLLARSGHLYEAENFLEILSPPPEGTWTALLSACKTYGDEEVGLRCFQQLVQLNPEDATWYVIMADIYASAGKWDDALRIEELRQLARADKKPAVALMELKNKVHEFRVGNDQDIKNLAGMRNLWPRMKLEGHVPDLDLSRIQFL